MSHHLPGGRMIFCTEAAFSAATKTAASLVRHPYGPVKSLLLRHGVAGCSHCFVKSIHHISRISRTSRAHGGRLLVGCREGEICMLTVLSTSIQG